LTAARPERVDTAWRVLSVVQAGLTSLEDGAARLAAAEVAGFIALSTGLRTFENGPPRVLAWMAWALLVAALTFLAPVVTPRRLGRFWSRILPRASDAVGAAVSRETELAVVEEMIERFGGQHDRMYRRLRMSIALAVAGTLIVSLAFVLEKAFYAP